MLTLILALPLAQAPVDQLDVLTASYAAEGVEVEARIELLTEAADLHAPGAPRAADITAFVAAALDDESFLVRARAADLLAGGLDHEPAMVALLDAAATFEVDAKRALEEIRARQNVMRDPNNRMHADQARELLYEIRRDYDACRERIEGFRYALTSALGERRDPRSVPGITSLFTIQATGARADASIDALLLLGTHEALERVLVIGVGSYDIELGRLKRRLESERSAVPGKRTDPQLTDEEWERRERLRLANDAKGTQRMIEELERWGTGFHARLAGFAEAYGLPPAPEGLTLSGWNAWFKTAEARLPKEPRD